MAKKQHQLDRERSSGYREVALCGRDMPRENTWGFESCERCADVARARKDRKDKETLHGGGAKHGHATKKSPAQINTEINKALASGKRGHATMFKSAARFEKDLQRAKEDFEKNIDSMDRVLLTARDQMDKLSVGRAASIGPYMYEDLDKLRRKLQRYADVARAHVSR